LKSLQKYWMLVFVITFGLYSGLPFLAPVFMHIGWKEAGNAIYFIYSFLCHQLPERSFFLFGPKLSYSLEEIGATGQDTSNIFVLRQFIGNSTMGWKVAWSDRMVAMFTSLWVFGLLWWPLRKRLRDLPLWGLILSILPLAIDGGTHFVSDMAGMGRGFRDTNLWLATLSQNIFRPEFYSGDAWGSFNSIMRLTTGILFGLGIVWFALPYLNEVFSEPDLSVHPNL
jgi:uncharacterized membrane protein